MRRKTSIAVILFIVVVSVCIGIGFFYYYNENKENEAKRIYNTMVTEGRHSREDLLRFVGKYPKAQVSKTVQYRIGKIYLEEKAYKKAIDAFKKSGKLPSIEIEAERLYAISLCYFELNEYEKALSFIKSIIDDMHFTAFRYIEHMLNIYEERKKNISDSSTKKEMIEKQLSMVLSSLEDYKNDNKRTKDYKDILVWKIKLEKELKSMDA